MARAQVKDNKARKSSPEEPQAEETPGVRAEKQPLSKEDEQGKSPIRSNPRTIKRLKLRIQRKTNHQLLPTTLVPTERQSRKTPEQRPPRQGNTTTAKYREADNLSVKWKTDSAKLNKFDNNLKLQTNGNQCIG
ncbi:hypothetical protein C922_05840 [Plasmodium inui San Antonio 1]|uniref:Uncharacterized protein n=1 Tax=Plasmodium inui San Antonio 1 TaxID=1237626 RepID=W7A3X1_9APIC|nr:hypothetical protein C922_05840 [Plasmodium inui San Antonio 1]EUD63779.1 hypothetical protein C922_05840 [Plasmodium inui San Antonio 1]